jgi:hypothetical protein
VVLVAVVWIACRIAEQKGRSEAERARHREETATARRANEIDEDVKRLPDADLDRELRDGR